jgi:hypothetical protein
MAKRLHQFLQEKDLESLKPKKRGRKRGRILNKPQEEQEYKEKTTEEEEEEIEIEVDLLKTNQIREKLKDNGLPIYGKKTVLLDRFKKFLNEKDKGSPGKKKTQKVKVSAPKPKTKRITSSNNTETAFENATETQDSDVTLEVSPVAPPIKKRKVQEKKRTQYRSVEFDDIVPDRIFRNVILDHLDSFELTSKEDLKSLTIIDATMKDEEEEKIQDLTGIELCQNVKKLFLSNNEIKDLSCLKDLSNLEELWLEGNKITDLSPLSNLVQLKTLHVNHNLFIHFRSDPIKFVI